MTGRARGRRAVVVVALVLSGCTGGTAGSQPTPSTGSTGSASITAPPSPSSAPTPPPLPAAARKPTAEGAEAFFRHFWDLYNYSYKSLEPDRFESISAKSCKSCAGYVRDIERARLRQFMFSGGVVTVTTAVAGPGRPGDGLIVNGVISQTDAQTKDKSGALMAEVKGKSGKRIDAAVRWTNGRWMMVGMDAVS